MLAHWNEDCPELKLKCSTCNLLIKKVGKEVHDCLEGLKTVVERQREEINELRGERDHLLREHDEMHDHLVKQEAKFKDKMQKLQAMEDRFKEKESRVKEKLWELLEHKKAALAAQDKMGKDDMLNIILEKIERI